MKVDLVRHTFTATTTIGSLAIDGIFCCYTLENPLQLNPVMGIDHIAIPYGHYPVKIRWSDRFKRQLPVLYNVPGRCDIEIHPGNFADDTHGCILPGMRRSTNAVYESIVAFEAILAKLRSAQDRSESIEMEITPTQEGSA